MEQAQFNLNERQAMKKMARRTLSTALALLVLLGGLSVGFVVSAAPFTTTPMIAASSDGSVLALNKDGTVWAWGNNIYGNLGTDGDVGRRVIVNNNYFATGPRGSSTACRVRRLTNIKAIAIDGISAALKDDGTVWAWGNGAYPWDGNISGSYSVVPVKVGLEDVVAIAVANTTIAALKADGTVCTYGAVPFTGNRENGIIAQAVGMSNVTAIGSSASVAGPYFVALKNDGTVWGWGKGWWQNDSYGSYYPLPSDPAYGMPTQVQDVNDVSALAIFGGCVARKKRWYCLVFWDYSGRTVRNRLNCY